LAEPSRPHSNSLFYERRNAAMQIGIIGLGKMGGNMSHNLKVVGSNPTPATKSRRAVNDLAAFAFWTLGRISALSTLCQQTARRSVSSIGLANTRTLRG
jgi:hypothetical protein